MSELNKKVLGCSRPIQKAHRKATAARPPLTSHAHQVSLRRRRLNAVKELHTAKCRLVLPAKQEHADREVVGLSPESEC